MSISIRIDANRIIRENAGQFAGINLNYLVDDDRNRESGAVPLEAALRDMGMKWLRYPGGEKSDTHFWRLRGEDTGQLSFNPDYRKLAEEQGKELLRFDDYVALCRSVGATPYVVTAYDNPLKYKTRYELDISLDDCIRNAVEWLTYANVTRGYGITYWEIGNENWHPESGMHPSRAADDILAIARAMKKVDPSIKLGVSGMDHADWWPVLLPKVCDEIDFLSVSEYACLNWGGYDHYVKHERVNLIVQAREAIRVIEAHASEEAKKRLQVVIAECNSKDFCGVPGGAWGSENNLGHAVVTFELIGQALLQPRIATAMLWNTRWIMPEEITIWDALDERNGLRPSGMAPAVWGRFLEGSVVEAYAPAPLVAFATYQPEEGTSTVFVINKDYREHEAEIAFEGAAPAGGRNEIWRLCGDGPDDLNPQWSRDEDEDSGTDKRSVVLKPVSVTVIRYR